MSKLLSGPTDIAQVTNFIESVSNAYFSKERRTFKTHITFWDPTKLKYPNELVDIRDSQLPALYTRASRANLIEKLRAVASQFIVTVDARDSEGDLIVRTRAIDKTLLEDLVSGQTFPPLSRDFVITSSEGGCYDSRTLIRFCAYRDQMIANAQERLTGSVAKSAHRLLTEL